MALGADLRQGAQYNEAPEGAGRPKKDTPRKGVAVTKKAADQTADKPEPPAKSWLEKDRLSVVFPGWQRDYAAEIEALLQASPAAEKPVTPAAVVGMIFELSQAHAVHLGLVVDPPVKTAAEVLGEGRAALSGEGRKAVPVRMLRSSPPQAVPLLFPWRLSGLRSRHNGRIAATFAASRRR